LLATWVAISLFLFHLIEIEYEAAASCHANMDDAGVQLNDNNTKACSEANRPDLTPSLIHPVLS